PGPIARALLRGPEPGAPRPTGRACRSSRHAARPAFAPAAVRHRRARRALWGPRYSLRGPSPRRAGRYRRAPAHALAPRPTRGPPRSALQGPDARVRPGPVLADERQVARLRRAARR